MLSNDTIIENTSEEIKSGIIETYQNLSGYKPLGTLGHYTINESIMYLYNFNNYFIINNLGLSISHLRSAGLLYKTIVNWVKAQKTNIATFVCPAITYLLFKTINNSLLDSIQINFKKDKISEENISVKNTNTKNTNSNINNIKSVMNNSKKPNYFKIIINIIIFMFIVYFVVDFNSLLENILKITFKQVLKINIIIASLFLIYLFIDLYIFILFLKGKIKIPYYLPPFLLKWVHKKKVISKYKAVEIRAFMDLYVKNILSHIVGLLFLIIFFICL